MRREPAVPIATDAIAEGIHGYAVAVGSVTAAFVIARLLEIHLVGAPAMLFLCATMLSAWFGGARPALLALALSFPAFVYYFTTPTHTFAVNLQEVPRIVIFVLSALFVVSLSAKQRSATEQLRRINEALQAENAERKRAKQALDRSVRQLRALGTRLMHTQDDERRRIARMLHETTAQDLAALKMLLARLNRTADGLGDDQRGALTESISLADQSMTQIRTLSYLLHPPFLDEMGLLAALRWHAAGFAERSGIAVALDLPERFERLPLDTETALFRIVQESLINIHRHAASQTARILLQRDAESLVLEIEDRGRGIATTLLERITSGGGVVGVGIAGMRERIEQLGGRLAVTSSDRDTTGTTVRVRLPLVSDAG
jgi:signal transduction histidine kinase